MNSSLIIILSFISLFSIEIYGQQNKHYQLELSEMFALDQKFRNTGHVGEEQGDIDKSNQDKLDSLYNIYGFPTENVVGVEGQLAMWHILQHSIDCEFNKTWFYRIVDQYEKGHVTSKITDFINGTFHRFFINDASLSRTKEVGMCYKMDSEDNNLFLEKLKKDFSSETKKALGIDF